ncbi:hypothetical protein AKH00_09405 [Microbacterium sp. GCS4]|nr:hypothetical protein AKH00_09405 [Microbacterium sp. GCS4]
MSTAPSSRPRCRRPGSWRPRAATRSAKRSEGLPARRSEGLPAQRSEELPTTRSARLRGLGILPAPTAPRPHPPRPHRPASSPTATSPTATPPARCHPVCRVSDMPCSDDCTWNDITSGR